jgi:hypothetical protein
VGHLTFKVFGKFHIEMRKELEPVAYAYNPSFSGGRDPYLKKTHHKKKKKKRRLEWLKW